MKFNNKLIGIFLFAVMGFTLLISSCDIKNPAEGLEVRIKNITRTTYITVKFVDAATGELVTSDVNINFTGDAKGKVITSSNTPVSSLTAKQGIASFSLADDLVPSAQSPIKLNLVCKSTGYLNSSKPLKVYESGTTNFQVVLTNTTNTPSGVVSQSQGFGSANGSGGTASDINISVKENNTGANAAIKVPAGTQLLDGNGNPLTGDIETRLTYFNPIDESSTNAFPGGFSVDVKDSDGQMRNGGFVTAGFVAVDMTVGGTDVEGFSGSGLSIAMEIPQGTNNPEKGRDVQVGDVIPLWSYDEDAGEWKFEKNVTVETITAPSAGMSVMNGKMGITIEGISHLSYFNLDWFEWYSSTCYQGATLRLRNTAGGCFSVTVKVMDNTTGNPASYWSTHTFKGIGQDNIDIFNSVANRPVTIQVFDSFSNVKLAEKIIDNLCEQGIVEIPFNQTTSSYQSVTINLTIKCDSQSDNPVGLSPDGFPLWARKITASGGWNGSWFEIGSFQDGSLTSCLEIGAYYEFAVEYDGEYYYSLDYTDPFLIDKAVINYNIIDDSRICDDL